MSELQRYMRPLLERITSGQLDPTFIIARHLPLGNAPKGYEMLHNKVHDCVKVVLKA